MEPSESNPAAAVSNGEEDPQQQQLGSEPSSPLAHPPPSDLNHAAEEEQEDALGGEFLNKLDLNGADERGAETGEKVPDFNDDGAVRDDEVSGKGGEGFDGGSRGWETSSWDGNVNEDVGGEAYGGLDFDVDGMEQNEEVGIEAYGGRDGDVYGDVGEVGIEAYGGRDGDVYGGVDGVEQNEEKSSGRTPQYPLRPDAEDCAFYMKTGSCKFGFNCRFNHPIRRRNQAVKEKAGEREEPTERSSLTECKYYQRSGGCKFGKACKYNHPKGNSSTAPTGLNFLGLPIRLGERECPYYMRTGSCKFGANCRFNHPDPTTVGGSDPPSGYGNGGSFQGVSPPSVPSWSSSRTLNETSFAPLKLTPSQGVSPQSSDWNGYQAPVYQSERSMHPPSSYLMNNPAIETNVYMHRQVQMPIEEYPERPGEPECSYFLKTGACKFKSNCKFHHPRNRVARLPPCILSDKGLPLRPGQNVCLHYSQYGICKFGPACKYDHPISSFPAMIPGLGPQPYTNSASVEVTGMGGSAGASDVRIQQSV